MLGAVMELVQGSSSPLMKGTSGEGRSNRNTSKQAACSSDCLIGAELTCACCQS